MEIHLLGPLVVCVDGGEVDISSPLAKGLLALLVVAPNRKMSHAEIVTRLWPGERVPLDRIREARRALRKRLPEVKPRNLNLHCMIDLSGWSVDFARFTSGVTEAKRLEGHARVERLQRALDEWRSEPLVDADLAKFDLCREQEYLDGLRRAATFDLLEATAECGDRVGFRIAVHDAVGRWPHDVPMLTLVSGVIAKTESGSSAGSFLARHCQEHGDSEGRLAELQSLYGPHPTVTSPRSGARRQVPAFRPKLVGRHAELRELDSVLVRAKPGDARIALVTGMAGVGKTALVRDWAHQMEDEFPGGTLHVDLNGFGATAPESPEEILTRFLKNLDVEPPTTTLDGLITEFRSATSGRSLLVVLDNARDAAQARPLLPGTGCAVVITSRTRLESLIAQEGAHPLTVRPLARSDAIAMLTGSLGEHRTRHTGHFVDEIAELVGGLPLALAVVAARLHRHPAEEVRATRDLLRETKSRLDALSPGREADLNVRVALSYSHGGLTGTAAELWALLALHPGPSVSLAAVANLAGRDCAADIDELVAAHLLEEPIHRRYAMHDLVRDYGLELALRLSPGHAEGAIVAAFEYLLQHVWACDQALVPGRELPVPAASAGQVAVPPTARDAMEWLDVEYPTITAALRQAAETGDDQHTWLLAMALVTYQWRRSRFADAERYLRAAAEAAERVAGLADQAMVYRMLGGSRWNMKVYPLAEAAQRRAIQLSEGAGDTRGLAYGLFGMAAIHLGRAEHSTASAVYGRARALFQQLGDELGEADALGGLARVALAEGDHDEAVGACSDARDRFAHIGDMNGEASILVLLGDVHADRGDLSKAAANYDFAVSHYRSLTRRSHEAKTLVRLADVLRRDSRADESEQALRSARALYHDLGDTSGVELVDEMLANV
ncbi:AAA family ATPase [Amycolatopsis sp. WQ 127309]|uniref:AfsR/SARP family transcriptional regulator n=1 Tax=Amycolatopsis sp. WQ 127309 TaxID=2932773 RepID=UPI001FF4445E|nr:AAA family ATPase [Amycolatopsis sp. WQ 127309]UOZ07028.1 AAA family ATPase [Amycolatopsis sp. WQ 127309]